MLYTLYRERILTGISLSGMESIFPSGRMNNLIHRAITGEGTHASSIPLRIDHRSSTSPDRFR